MACHCTYYSLSTPQTDKLASTTTKPVLVSSISSSCSARSSCNSIVSELKGWYNKDDVVAEWKKVNGDVCLHVHCYVSGPNSFTEVVAEFRYHIFSKELPLVLQAVMHGDSILFRDHPELMDALVRVYFHSTSSKFNRLEYWSPLKDAAEESKGFLI